MKKLTGITLALLALILPSASAKETVPVFKPSAETIFSSADPELWAYLRAGLTYLESPQPLSPPEAVDPAYVHPDGKGFGAYGFSPEAYQDVQRLYPFFRGFSWKQLLASPELYDLANRALCDWMLKGLRDYLPPGSSKEEIFAVLHRAWNLGLTGFKRGRQVVASRQRRAGEFLLRQQQTK